MSEDNIPPDSERPEKEIPDNKDPIEKDPIEEELAAFFGCEDEEETAEEIREDRDQLRKKLADTKEAVAQLKARIAKANEKLAECQREADLAIESIAQEALTFEREKIKDFVEDLRTVFSVLEKELSDISSTASSESVRYIEGAQKTMGQLTAVFNGFSQPPVSPPLKTEQPVEAVALVPETTPAVETAQVTPPAQDGETETPESIRVERDALKQEFIELGEEIVGLHKKYAKIRRETGNIQSSLPNIVQRQKDLHKERELFVLEKVLKKMLPALDTMERGVSFVSDDQKKSDPALGAFVTCIEKSTNALSTIFSKHGISIINPSSGTEMDYDKHQAIKIDDEADVPPDTIVNVQSRGYELNGRIIRTAQVIVRS